MINLLGIKYLALLSVWVKYVFQEQLTQKNTEQKYMKKSRKSLGNLIVRQTSKKFTLEIIYALFNSYQLDINEIERSRFRKLNKRGGFEDRIILEKVIEK